MRKELRKRKNNVKKKNRKNRNRVCQVVNLILDLSQSQVDFRSHSLSVGIMTIKAERRLCGTLQMVKDDTMNLNLFKKLKPRTNQWDSWREQGQQKEMSRHQFSQMQLKKFIRRAEILIQYKGRMKQLNKRAQWNALVKSLKNLYLVSICKINPMISSQQTKRVTIQEPIQKKQKL